MENFSLARVPEIAFGNGRLADLPARIGGLAGLALYTLEYLLRLV